MAGIYIHIPFCKQACYYCNFHFSTTKNHKILIKSIQDEIYLKKNFLNKEKIKSIYFGGGTPSLIKSEYIKQLIKTLKTHFEIKNNCEIISYYRFKMEIYMLNYNLLEILPVMLTVGWLAYGMI